MTLINWHRSCIEKENYTVFDNSGRGLHVAESFRIIKYDQETLVISATIAGWIVY